MSRVFNFRPGPAALPVEVLEQARADMPDWQGSGMSVMEVSHRGKAFAAGAEQAEADLRELMDIPADYAVMFLQGGATLQFALLPMNLSRPGETLDYLDERLRIINRRRRGAVSRIMRHGAPPGSRSH